MAVNQENGESIDTQKETFEGFNLGIIVQPKQKADVEKTITNVKLINTPNVVFNGNPQTQNMPGVTDLDGNSENNGSSYTRMEVEENNIYGSDLTLTYTIEVKNTSDINYYETKEEYQGWYYMFGEHDENYSKEVQMKIDSVVDCYDPVLTYASGDNGIIKTISYDSVNKTWGDKDIDRSVKVQEDLSKTLSTTGYTYTQALKITGWDNIARNQSAKISLDMNKTLSTSDEDLDFINIAAVGKTSKTVAKEDENNPNAIETLKLSAGQSEPKVAYAEATITTPTGSDKVQTQIVYPIIGITLLVIVAGGIIVINKKRK